MIEKYDVEPKEDPRIAKFTVTDPTDVGGAVRYTITGEDEEGDFKTQRRYKEFDALNLMLRARWPGCYVPGIPQKKMMGSKEENVVNDRRVLLE